MIEPRPELLYEDHPDHPGWKRWGFRDQTRYNAFLGEMLVRLDDGIACVRMTPEHRHSNLGNNVHGGTLLGFIDVALFAASRAFGLIEAGTAVTLDLNTHFIGAGRVGEPLEARVELLRETRRLLFLRGLLMQAEDVICEFSGTIRKPSQSPSPLRGASGEDSPRLSSDRAGRDRPGAGEPRSGEGEGQDEAPASRTAPLPNPLPASGEREH